MALPAIDEDLLLSTSALPWVLNAYGVAIAGLLLLGGRMADVLGRREIFAAGMALFTAASLVGGFAETPALLIAMRALQGIGAALVTPAALSIITTSFDDELRKRALGIWGAVGASALAAGLILGAIITEAIGWRWILWVNVPIGVLALALTPAVLPKSRRVAGQTLDLPGALVAVTGLVALVYGVGRIEQTGIGSSVTLVLLIGGLALLLAFPVIERFVRSPLAPPALLANRSVASANLVSLAANGSFAGAFVLLSLHLQLVLDIGTLATGFVLVPMALSLAIAAGALSARLVGRVGPRALIVGGMTGSALGLVGLGLAVDDEFSWALVLPGSVVAGLGYGIAFPAWTVVGVEQVADERQGVASGLLATTQEVGAAIGFAAMVAIAAAVVGDGTSVDARADGYRWAIIAAAGMAALGAALAALTPRVTKARPTPLTTGGLADMPDLRPGPYLREPAARGATPRRTRARNHPRPTTPKQDQRRGALRNDSQSVALALHTIDTPAARRAARLQPTDLDIRCLTPNVGGCIVGRLGRAVGMLVVAVSLAASTAGCGDDDKEQTGGVPATLRMAVTDLQGLEELQREFGAFKAEFERAAKVKLEFFPVTNRTAAAAALSSDRVDLVFTGPAEYVVLNARTKAEPVIAIRRPDYHSCVYVKADSPVRSLTDLKGKKLGMSDIGSTSGHLGPSQLVVGAGVDPQDQLEVLTIGDAVHQALKRGDVDAVGVGCHDRDEYIEGDESDYRTVVEGPPLPPDVIMAHPDLSDEAVTRVREAFEGSWATLLPALLEGKDNAKYENATLVVPKDSDYDVVRSMYRAIGVDDFTEFVGD